MLGCFGLSPQARAVCQQGCNTINNTFLGDDALQNKTGFDNTAVGAFSLMANNGFENTGVGTSTLRNNTTGSDARLSRSSGSSSAFPTAQPYRDFSRTPPPAKALSREAAARQARGGGPGATRG